MEGYKSTVKYCSKSDITAKERIKLKDTTNAIALDEVTQGEDSFVIPVDYIAELAIHNEYAEDKDYSKYIVVDTAGTKYVTGSNSFWTALQDIMGEMIEAGETDITIEVYRRDSKNYKGKQFITCSLV